MDKQSRRAAVRDYKERKVPAGVFSLSCAASGEVWVGLSRNLDGQKNSLFFGLRTGGHLNRRLQAAWNAHGAEAFEFAVVEALEDEDLTAYGREDWLKTRERHWREALQAHSITG